MPTKDKKAQKKSAPAPVKHSPGAAHLKFSSIGSDMVVLKDGSGRAVLEITPISLAGFSEEEHKELAEKYANFLNTLEDPVQILMKSRALDIDGYLNALKEKESTEDRPLFKSMLKEYRGLIEKFLPYSGYGIMSRKVYMVVPIEPVGASKSADPISGFFANLFSPNKLLREAKQKQKQQRELYGGLKTKCDKIMADFQIVGLPIRRLSTMEIMRLFAEVYHPATHDEEHDELLDQFDAAAHPTA
jgi:hypothetical protein